MEIPFTTEQFFHVIEKYHAAIFPMQWLILFLGFVAVFLLNATFSFKNKYIGGFLSPLVLVCDEYQIKIDSSS